MYTYTHTHTHRYLKCLYCYNKADAVTIEELDVLARQPNSMVMSCHLNINTDRKTKKHKKISIKIA